MRRQRLHCHGGALTGNVWPYALHARGVHPNVSGGLTPLSSSSSRPAARALLPPSSYVVVGRLTRCIPGAVRCCEASETRVSAAPAFRCCCRRGGAGPVRQSRGSCIVVVFEAQKACLQRRHRPQPPQRTLRAARRAHQSWGVGPGMARTPRVGVAQTGRLALSAPTGDEHVIGGVIAVVPTRVGVDRLAREARDRLWSTGQGLRHWRLPASNGQGVHLDSDATHHRQLRRLLGRDRALDRSSR
jgi:hypothetical protein